MFNKLILIILLCFVWISFYSCSHGLDMIGNPDAPSLTLNATCDANNYNLSWDKSGLALDNDLTLASTIPDPDKISRKDEDFYIFHAYFVYRGLNTPYEDLAYLASIPANATNTSLATAADKDNNTYVAAKGDTPYYFRVVIMARKLRLQQPDETDDTDGIAGYITIGFTDYEISSWAGGTEEECNS